MTKPNTAAYLTSLAHEAIAQSQRVRNLIGDKHWLSDGHHHESVLASVISRHLGSGIKALRGFIVNPLDHSECSTEQDILIIDCRHQSPIFMQHGLAITFPEDVLAAISVKARMTSGNLQDAMDGLASVKKLANSRLSGQSSIWCSAFFFDIDSTINNDNGIVYKYLKKYISDPERPDLASQLPDLIATAQQFCYRVSGGAEPSASGVTYADMSFAVFLASLIDHISSKIDQTPSPLAEMVENYSFGTIGEVPLSLL